MLQHGRDALFASTLTPNIMALTRLLVMKLVIVVEVCVYDFGFCVRLLTSLHPSLPSPSGSGKVEFCVCHLSNSRPATVHSRKASLEQFGVAASSLRVDMTVSTTRRARTQHAGKILCCRWVK